MQRSCRGNCPGEEPVGSDREQVLTVILLLPVTCTSWSRGLGRLQKPNLPASLTQSRNGRREIPSCTARVSEGKVLPMSVVSPGYH